MTCKKIKINDDYTLLFHNYFLYKAGPVGGVLFSQERVERLGAVFWPKAGGSPRRRPPLLLLPLPVPCKGKVVLFLLLHFQAFRPAPKLFLLVVLLFPAPFEGGEGQDDEGRVGFRVGGVLPFLSFHRTLCPACYFGVSEEEGKAGAFSARHVVVRGAFRGRI